MEFLRSSGSVANCPILPALFEKALLLVFLNRSASLSSVASHAVLLLMGQERAWRTPKNYVCVEGHVFRALTVCDPNSFEFSAGHGIAKIPNIGKKELLLSKSRNYEWGPLYLIVFALKLQKVRTTCNPCDFWVSIGATVKTACMWKLKKSIEKNTIWLNLHGDKAIRSKTWCDKVETWISFKVVQYNPLS